VSEFRRGSPSANEKPRAAPASASHLWGAHPADAECVLTHVHTCLPGPPRLSPQSPPPKPAAGSSFLKVSHLECRSVFDGPFALF
jgi:hypothetical protein